jgi:hypothetical protein
MSMSRWFLHGFHDADLRLQRAKKHLAELDQVVESFRDIHEEGTADDSQIEADNHGADCLENTYVGELGCGQVHVIVSDIVQNLRTALNYLVTALAEHDSPQKTLGQKVQFPIDSTPKLFTSHRATYLEGVSDEHVAMIERLQPYNGCEWTKLLRELSNRDKHVRFVIVEHNLWRRTVIFEADGDADDYEMDVRLIVEGEITFPDGTPIIDALQILDLKISDLLVDFDAILIREFKAQLATKRK